MEREAGERVCDFEAVEKCMTEKEAKQEAGRCLRCDHFGYGIFKGGINKLNFAVELGQIYGYVKFFAKKSTKIIHIVL